jgi:hypothetical protein
MTTNLKVGDRVKEISGNAYYDGKCGVIIPSDDICAVLFDGTETPFLTNKKYLEKLSEEPND